MAEPRLGAVSALVSFEVVQHPELAKGLAMEQRAQAWKQDHVHEDVDAYAIIALPLHNVIELVDVLTRLITRAKERTHAAYRLIATLKQRLIPFVRPSIRPAHLVKAIMCSSRDSVWVQFFSFIAFFG